MPSYANLITIGLGLISAAAAAPNPPLSERTYTFEARQIQGGSSVSSQSSTTSTSVQSGSSSASGGLTDVDIAQFALTLEHLEGEFYRQSFAKFPNQQFLDLGMSQEELTALQETGSTELTHVMTLQSAITAAGAQPVQQCQYNFGLTDPRSMIATARVLEAVGVTAYLGAASSIKSSAVLNLAGSIVTIEARHQSLLRLLSGATAIPNAFDTRLSPRQVFTMAAPFITSCPQGSNLNLQAFPSIRISNPVVSQGQMLVLSNSQQPSNARFCGFINEATPQFTPLNNGQCQVPGGLSGDAFMIVSTSQSIDDTNMVAGPTALQIS